MLYISSENVHRCVFCVHVYVVYEMKGLSLTCLTVSVAILEFGVTLPLSD